MISIRSHAILAILWLALLPTYLLFLFDQQGNIINLQIIFQLATHSKDGHGCNLLVILVWHVCLVLVRTNNFFVRTKEMLVWHCDAIYIHFCSDWHYITCHVCLVLVIITNTCHYFEVPAMTCWNNHYQSSCNFAAYDEVDKGETSTNQVRLQKHPWSLQTHAYVYIYII